MPLYSYDCESCGPFTDWRSMSEAAAPVDCPNCQAPAPRAVSSPFLANMDPGNRIAHQRNEKSAHEPRIEAREKGGHSAHKGHKHPHRHGCGGHSHGHGRPWMIGH